LVCRQTNKIKMNPKADLIKIKSELLLKNTNTQPITEHEVLSILSNELPQFRCRNKKHDQQGKYL
jgi:hypothetical protein